MTAQELAGIASMMPSDAQVRFTCRKNDNPHDDYYEVHLAYLLEFQGEEKECALYLTGSST